MAGYRALAAAGRSLLEVLDAGFAAVLPAAPRPTTFLASTDDLRSVSGMPAPCVSVLVYRVDPDDELRSPIPHNPGLGSEVHASAYVLRLIVTAHDTDAAAELEWLGLVASILAETALIGWPLLHPSGAFERRDTLQVIPETLSTADWSLVFRALGIPQRPALAYLVRGVRIDGVVTHPEPSIDRP